MKRILLALVCASALFATDSTKTKDFVVEKAPKAKAKVAEEKLTFTPIIKSEFLVIQGLAEDARPVIIFGDNDFGVVATKGDVEVAGAISLIDYAETESGLGVVINKAYVKKGLGESGLDLTFGYKNLPYGHWTSNSVNYPMVRTGNYDPAFDAYKVKTKAPQVELGYTGTVIVADVAGYVGTTGNATSIAAKVGANLDAFAPNISIRADGMDTVDMAIGADVDLGTVGMSGVYSRGLNADRMGTYFELSVFPNDVIIPSIRAELLADTETKNGVANFSLSNLFLITDNVYAGLEYNILSSVLDSELQTPDHGLTVLIGCEF